MLFDLPKLKAAARGAANKTQDFVSGHKVQRVAKMGQKAIEIAAQLGQAKLKGTMGYAGVALGVLNIIAEAKGEDLYTAVKTETLQRNLKAIDSTGAITLLAEVGFFNSAELVCSDKKLDFLSLKLIDGREICAMFLTGRKELAPWWDAYVSESITTVDMATTLWDVIGKSVAIASKENSAGRTVLSISQLPHECESYHTTKGNNSPKDVAAKFKTYRSMGVSKAYMCIGPPGTGKSTFCHQLAIELGGAIMRITPAIFDCTRVSHQEVIDLVGSFKPSVLVLEDVDRVRDSQLLLSLVDFIRQKNPEVLLLSTINDPTKVVDALRRPGRLGEPLNFVSPDKEYRRMLLERFRTQFGVTRDISYLADIMEHPQFSQDFIRNVAQQALVEDDETLKMSISDAIENLKNVYKT